MLSYSFYNKVVNLSWKNDKEFQHIYMLQTGPAFWTKYWKDKNFFIKRVHNVIKWNFQRTIFSNNIDIYSLNSVLDVGSGVGLFDIILSKINTNCKFYLLDKSLISPLGIHRQYFSYENNHGFYNNWSVVNDIIETSNANLQQFDFLSPESVWPENLDLVISMNSWCWHYPKDVYWDKLLASLKIGGYLILDVLNLKDRDMAGEITEELKSVPIAVPRTLPTDKTHSNIDEFTINGNNIYGYCYCWKRNN